jgi:hypothetical protein
MMSVKYTFMPHTLLPHHFTDWGLNAPALKVKAATFWITKFNNAARNEHNILSNMHRNRKVTVFARMLFGYQLCHS